MTIPDHLTSWDLHDANSERAAEFFERQRCGEWDDKDQAVLDAWLAESTLHHVAWLRVQGIAARADRLAALNALELKQAGQSGGAKFPYRRFAFPLLAAASIALITPFAIPFVNSLLEPPVRSFSTDIGGRTLLRFVDGTEFELNTDTTVRYRMTNRERMVWLDKGEAWFHVSHNPANPFVLIAGKHQVTDLGTEFLVRRTPGRMEVALLNGRASLSTDGTQTAMLRPGDDAIASSLSVMVTRKAPQDLADELAWRRGVLVFRSTRLADVVREVNRYNTTKLVIADPSIENLKFTGEIATGDFEDFLSLAQTALNLHVDRRGNDILISRLVRNETKRAVHLDRSL